MVTITTPLRDADPSPAGAFAGILPDVTRFGRGRSLVVREMGSDDVEALRELYASLSPDDLRRRFFVASPPPANVLERWAQATAGGGCSVLAVERDGHTERVVAEAGFSPADDAGCAELAVTVRHGARGWLGAHLVSLLVACARVRGVTQLYAEVMCENRPMRRVLASFGATSHFEGDGISRMTIALGAAPPVSSTAAQPTGVAPLAAPAAGPTPGLRSAPAGSRPHAGR